MKALIQRVNNAKVEVNAKVTGEIPNLSTCFVCFLYCWNVKYQMLDLISRYFAEYEYILITIGIVSGVVFIVRLLAMPWLLGTIPVDYFTNDNHCKNESNFFITVIKNIFGFVFFLFAQNFFKFFFIFFFLFFYYFYFFFFFLLFFFLFFYFFF